MTLQERLELVSQELMVPVADLETLAEAAGRAGHPLSVADLLAVGAHRDEHPSRGGGPAMAPSQVGDRGGFRIWRFGR